MQVYERRQKPTKAILMINNLAVIGRNPSTFKIIGARLIERHVEKRAILLEMDGNPVFYIGNEEMFLNQIFCGA